MDACPANTRVQKAPGLGHVAVGCKSRLAHKLSVGEAQSLKAFAGAVGKYPCGIDGPQNHRRVANDRLQLGIDADEIFFQLFFGVDVDTDAHPLQRSAISRPHENIAHLMPAVLPIVTPQSHLTRKTVTGSYVLHPRLTSCHAIIGMANAGRLFLVVSLRPTYASTQALAKR